MKGPGKYINKMKIILFFEQVDKQFSDNWQGLNIYSSALDPDSLNPDPDPGYTPIGPTFKIANFTFTFRTGTFCMWLTG